MPGFGLGVFQVEKYAIAEIVKNAIEVGYRSIDTAAIYRNEADVGMGIKQALALLGINFTLESQIIGLIMFLLMGLFMFMNVPGLQLYAVQLSEKYVPSATAMASALNISAFNVGIFLGSYVGVLVVHYQSLKHTPIYGFLMVIVAAIVTLIWVISENKQKYSSLKN